MHNEGLYIQYLAKIPHMYRVSHVNNNMYFCSVVTSQLHVEITYLFYDYEITLFTLSLGKIYTLHATFL